MSKVILIIGGLALLKYIIDKYVVDDYDEYPIHHDNLKTSFYSISHQVNRDERKRRGY